jgi:predicted ATPase/class 3 adenylate cyclase
LPSRYSGSDDPRGAIISDAMTASDTAPVTTPPTGTVTFFFSDIEGSTRLLESLGSAFADVLQKHRTALRRAFAEHGGIERGTEGDSFFVAFADATKAVGAAVTATRNLAAVAWPEGTQVRVRIGLHTGEGRLVDGDYVGLDVHRAARIAAAGHGGQVLISQSTRILVDGRLPADASLRDLGEHRLKDLSAPEHLYQLSIAGLPADFPPLRSLARTVANLPAQLSTIIGRDADVAAVRSLLTDSRLVTITGTGGTGKTRLAQEVARQLVGADSADVVFVPLQALTDASLIPVEILRALRMDIAAARDPFERVIEHLASRRTVLVLDNLEQIGGAGLMVKSLLDEAPPLAVLAASQAALHVGGELEYALATLPVPATPTVQPDTKALAGNPAVGLFVDRARAVRADFALDAANAAAVAEICARLDGLPLAIELAAAQVKVLSPSAILERISGRIDTLSSRRDDLPERQRTLRATVAWSYELLAEPERRLFRRLAVFVGGARLSEVEAIAAIEPAVVDPIDALGTLVDRSLVTVRHGTADDDRFLLLQTVRAHGRELLREEGEEATMLGRHAAIYRDLARTAEPQLYGTSRRMWLDRLVEDHDNLRAALDELEAAGDLAGAMDLAADLWRFWQQRGHLLEGRERVDHLLELAAAPNAPDVPAAIRSRVEEAAGSIRYWTGPDRVTPRPFYERAVEYAVASGDRRREAWARYNLAFVFDFTPAAETTQPDPARASELRAQELDIFREIGDRRGIAESLWAMGGNALLIFSDPARARKLLDEAIPLLDGIGDLYALGWANVSRAMLDAAEGDVDAAEDRIMQAADVFIRGGDTSGEFVAVQALGSIAARRGDDQLAARLSAAAHAAAREIGIELPRIPPIVEPLDAALARLSPEELTRESEVGVALGAKSILMTALEGWAAKGAGASAEIV